MGNRIVSGLNSIVFYTRRSLIRASHVIKAWVIATVGPTSKRWWENPLLHAARSNRRVSWQVVRTVVVGVALALMVLAILAWLITERNLGVVMLLLPLGIILLTLALTPSQGVASAASHFQQAGANPRQMSTADPVELVWGMSLVAMWRLRWLIAACLATTPALVVSVLHIDVSTFSNYRDSVIALGSAAPPDQVRLLGPAGAIPIVRLVLRAVGIGMTPYVLLPLLATMGVTATLALRDRVLSQTLSLITSVITLMVIGAIGQFLTTTFLLGAWLEIVRLILVAGYLAGIGVLTWRLNTLNADLLVNIPSDEGII